MYALNVYSEPILFLFGIAFFAIHWPAFFWLEWHFAFISAVCAGRFMHFARPKASKSAVSSIKVSHSSLFLQIRTDEVPRIIFDLENRGSL